jgi:sec-independent protein translocase protein TatA
MLGTGEIILIVFVFMMLFGGKKLPEMARGLGKGMREFRRALNFDLPDEQKPEEQKMVESKEPTQKKDSE